MIKFLLVVGVVAFVLWLMFGRKRGAPRAPTGAPQPMVRCAHCGVHLPKGDALLIGDDAFCSPAHRDAGARTP
jgi:uncharacterized protein